MFDFSLGETADAIRDTTARFAADHIAPLAAEIDESNTFPRQLWPQMGALGLHGITVEEEFGGAGLGYLEHVVAMEEVSRASASVGLSYGAHSNLCVNQVRRWASPEQKQRHLPKLISGEHVGSLAMSEAGAGSDVVSMRLRAERKGAPLHSERHQILDHQCAACRRPRRLCQDRSRRRSERHFRFSSSRRACPASASPRSSPSLACAAAIRPSLVFEDCEVPAEALMGREGEGVKILMSGLDYERAVLAGGPLGIMQACLDVVLPYVRDRKQFGRPIGDFQLMQAKIADMYVALNSSRAYVYSVARACDAGRATRTDAAAAILFASENAVKVSLEAIQALGGAGYTKEWPVERFLRDAKLYDIGAGTNEIRRYLIGRELIAS